MVFSNEEKQTKKQLRKIFNAINFSSHENIFGNLEDFQTSRRGKQSSVPKVSKCCYRQSHNTQGQEL